MLPDLKVAATANAGGAMTLFHEPAALAWRPIGAVAVIDLVGDVTRETEAPLRSVYQQVRAAGFRQILLHFHESDYIKSAGITLVLRLAAEAQRAGQQLVLTGLTPHFRRMFQMAGVEQYAPIAVSEAQALAALQPGADDSTAA
jgi:anti-anti-sigma factor